MSEQQSAENDAPLTHVPFIKAPMPDRRDFPRDTADYDADEDDFNQCPHEAIRATCPGCTCPCGGCERWRERDRARVLPPGEPA